MAWKCLPTNFKLTNVKGLQKYAISVNDTYPMFIGIGQDSNSFLVYSNDIGYCMMYSNINQSPLQQLIITFGNTTRNLTPIPLMFDDGIDIVYSYNNDKNISYYTLGDRTNHTIYKSNGQWFFAPYGGLADNVYQFQDLSYSSPYPIEYQNFIAPLQSDFSFSSSTYSSVGSGVFLNENDYYGSSSSSFTARFTNSIRYVKSDGNLTNFLGQYTNQSNEKRYVGTQIYKDNNGVEYAKNKYQYSNGQRSNTFLNYDEDKVINYYNNKWIIGNYESGQYYQSNTQPLPDNTTTFIHNTDTETNPNLTMTFDRFTNNVGYKQINYLYSIGGKYV